MVLGFGRSKKASIQGLILQRDYGGAIEQLRAQLQKRKGDERLRIRLGDVLVQAGRKDEAVEVLGALADDLALAGYAAKAIAILKRVHKLRPRDPDVEEKLAYMIKQQLMPAADPWASGRRRSQARAVPAVPEIGMEAIDDGGIGLEEIGEPPPEDAAEEPPDHEAGAEAAEPLEAQATEPSTETRAAEVAAPPAPTAAAAEEAGQVAEADHEEEVSFDDAFRDELASLIEDVFAPSEGGDGEADGEPVRGTAMVDTPLFQGFSEEELVAVIRGLELRIYEPGEIIMSAGEPGESLLILTSGRARAYTRSADGKHVFVRLMRDGDFFGEISVLTGNPRSATVTAASNCDLLELDRRTLDSISATHPHVREVLQRFYAERSGKAPSAE